MAVLGIEPAARMLSIKTPASIYSKSHRIEFLAFRAKAK